MAIKFYGEKPEFIERLNKAFNLKCIGKQVGNSFRFECSFEGVDYKVNLFDTGTVQIQPSAQDNFYKKVENALANHLSVAEISSYTVNDVKEEKKVFIVHGHDKNSKTSLENALFRWNLIPYAIQDEDSQGKTIIEFLESEINLKNNSVGIVLLTPDDMGYARKAGEDEKKPRARQNVILELGMFIGALGRERTIIIKKAEVESPSDIDGLIYISYDEEIDEIKDKLKIKLENLGFINNQ